MEFNGEIDTQPRGHFKAFTRGRHAIAISVYVMDTANDRVFERVDNFAMIVYKFYVTRLKPTF